MSAGRHPAVDHHLDKILSAPTREAQRTAMSEAMAAGGWQPSPDYFGGLVDRGRIAAERAVAKFPQPNYVALKIAEEAGEVVRGAVHYAEGRMQWEEVEGEIVQLLAMLIRFVTEGDQINGIMPPAATALLPPPPAEGE